MKLEFPNSKLTGPGNFKQQFDWRNTEMKRQNQRYPTWVGNRLKMLSWDNRIRFEFKDQGEEV